MPSCRKEAAGPWSRPRIGRWTLERRARSASTRSRRRRRRRGSSLPSWSRDRGARHGRGGQYCALCISYTVVPGARHDQQAVEFRDWSGRREGESMGGVGFLAQGRMKEILHTRSQVICYVAGKTLSVSHLFSFRIVMLLVLAQGHGANVCVARVGRLAEHRTAASQADNSLSAMRKGQGTQCQLCPSGEGQSDLQIAGNIRKLGGKQRLASVVTRAGEPAEGTRRRAANCKAIAGSV